jgi:hypothetical protein
VTGSQIGVSIKIFAEQSPVGTDGKPITKPQQTINIVPMGNSVGVVTGGKMVKATWLRTA